MGEENGDKSSLSTLRTLKPRYYPGILPRNAYYTKIKSRQKWERGQDQIQGTFLHLHFK